jgi:hypothetical protein
VSAPLVVEDAARDGRRVREIARAVERQHRRELLARVRAVGADAGLLDDQEPRAAAGVAVETGARVILVSSSYGMAALDADGFRGQCDEAGLDGILLYIGGNLSVSRQNRRWEDIEAEFKHHPSLAVNLLRLVNSAALTRGQTITSLRPCSGKLSST